MATEKTVVPQTSTDFVLDEDDLLDSNLFLDNSNGANEEEDLLNSNIDELLNSENDKAVDLLDDQINYESIDKCMFETNALRKVTPTPACNKDLELETFNTPELQKAASEKVQKDTLRPCTINREDINKSLTTIKEDCFEW